MNGLEPIKSTRTHIEESPDIEVIPNAKQQTGNAVANAVADNFPRILDLAESLIECNKMKVQSDAVIKKMEEDRKNLIAATDDYCKRAEKDTERYLGKLDKIRLMMQDYNKYEKNTRMSEEAFCSIITQIINEEQ